VHLDLQISPRIFGKIRNDPIAIIRSLGEEDSRKKPEAKNLVTLSLTLSVRKPTIERDGGVKPSPPPPIVNISFEDGVTVIFLLGVSFTL
jgi:hypothetical protein